MYNKRALKYLKKDKESIENKLEKLQEKLQYKPWEKFHENNLKLAEETEEYARGIASVDELAEIQKHNQKLKKEIKTYTKNHMKWLDEEIELKLDLDSVTKLINSLERDQSR